MRARGAARNRGLSSWPESIAEATAGPKLNRPLTGSALTVENQADEHRKRRRNRKRQGRRNRHQSRRAGERRAERWDVASEGGRGAAAPVDRGGDEVQRGASGARRPIQRRDQRRMRREPGRRELYEG